ncbi:hypothetical protein [Streptomyces sp. NPDC002057]|uniref:hypothetical protein n=1 Tax=Streptomyces sp. NPDC002057 TaxID=3154664 RepID=UPI00332BD395
MSSFTTTYTHAAASGDPSAMVTAADVSAAPAWLHIVVIVLAAIVLVHSLTRHHN